MSHAPLLRLATSVVMGMALPAPSPAPPTVNVLATKLEVASASARQNSVALTAWKIRHPDLFMSNVPRDFSLKRPDGSVLTWQSLYDRQKARMAAVRHIDRFRITIEVESVGPESATVRSIQDWSRVVRGADGKDDASITDATERYEIRVTLADPEERS